MAGFVPYCISLLIWTLLIILVGPLTLLCSIYRWTLSKLVPLWDPRYHKILSLDSGIQAGNRISTKLCYCIALEGPVTLEDVRSRFESRLVFGKDYSKNLTRPQLQQYLLPVGGYSFWKWDDSFNIKNHVNFLSTDEKFNGDAKTPTEILETLCRTTVKENFKPGQSPWELLVVPNFTDSAVYGQRGLGGYTGTLLVLKMDHVLGDGATVRLLLNDLFTHHDNYAEANSPYKIIIAEKIRTFFLGPWEMCRFFMGLKPYMGTTPLAQDTKPSFSSNIGVTPVITLDYFRKIRSTQSCTYTAAVLGIVARAYSRFAKKAGYDIPEHLVVTCTRGVSMPEGIVMGNFTTHAVAVVPLGVENSTVFQTVNASLKQATESLFPRFLYEWAKCQAILPNVAHSIFYKVPDPNCGTMGFTNVSFADENLSLGRVRLRSVFGIGLPETLGHGITCYSSSTRHGVRFVFQLDEGCVVPKTVLSANSLADFFVEEVKAFNLN